MLSFLPYDEIGDQRWDALVHASPEGWAWSTSHWRRVILNVNEWGLRDFSFGAIEHDRCVAVMPLQYQPSSRRMASTGWSAGGIALAPDLEPAEHVRITQAMLAHARQLAVEQRAGTLEITLSPLRRASLANPVVNPMVAHGFEDLSTQTLVADLRSDEDALWMALSKDARQAVKKAEKAGYRAIAGGWRTHADAYYPVHVETYTRTGVPPHPRAYFEGFAREMAPAGLAELWVGLAPDGEAVAFHNDTHFHQARVYHTGCSKTAHLDSGINYLLFWASITGARRAGCHWYEIGEIFPDANDGKHRGLTVFKAKFGGAPHRYFRSRQVLAAEPAADDGTADRVVRDVFSKSEVYATSQICARLGTESPDYAGRLLEDRFQIVAELCRGGTLVDLCCASGAHLVDVSQLARRAVGVDFTERYLAAANVAARDAGRNNVAFVQADARVLPLAANSVDVLYCFSSLYAIPRAEQAVAEVARVLRPGGHAVLDFGNRRSLNAYVARFYPDFTPLFPLSVAEIRASASKAGLTIRRHRRFQLLPLWADRPAWLWPLLHPKWKSIMKRRVLGRMIDEWVSSMPLLRAFAFRHVLVCQKPAAS